MEKLIKYLKAIDWRIYIILFFCFLGLYRNIFRLHVFGFDYGGLAARVLVAMLALYAAQIILIFLRERKVWVISALQVFFCFYVYEDFTFAPLTDLIKNLMWLKFPDMGYGWVKFMGTAIISALFTLEVLKTYILYALTEELPKKRPIKEETAA